jgi:hypothetical protein
MTRRLPKCHENIYQTILDIYPRRTSNQAIILEFLMDMGMDADNSFTVAGTVRAIPDPCPWYMGRIRPGDAVGGSAEINVSAEFIYEELIFRVNENSGILLLRDVIARIVTGTSGTGKEARRRF